MTTIYTYNITGDFTSGVDISQLQNEVIAETGITITLLGISTDNIDVFIYFVSSLSGPEKILLDAVIAAHIPGTTTPPAQSTGGVINYLTLHNRMTPLNTNYYEVASKLWNSDRFINYTDGLVLIKTTILGGALDIQIWDEDANMPLGNYTSSISENTSFSITLPTSDTLISIRIRKNTITLPGPVLESLVIEFTN